MHGSIWPISRLILAALFRRVEIPATLKFFDQRRQLLIPNNTGWLWLIFDNCYNNCWWLKQNSGSKKISDGVIGPNNAWLLILIDSHLHIENQNIVIHDLKWGIVHSVNNICATVVPTHYKTCEQYFQITVSTDIEILVHNCQMGVIWVGQSHHHLKYEKLWCSSQ